MHPRYLWEMCVDVIVQATCRYQHFTHEPIVVWADVEVVWKTVWMMSPPIPLRAALLLHSHLWQGLLPDAEIDVTRLLLTLLGAKCPKIALERNERPLDRTISLETFYCSGVYCNQNHLQELDISGLDLGQNGIFLQSLLPWCCNLTVLKLGVNATYGILYAAQACPITVLHISERLFFMSHLTERHLMEIVFGMRDRLAVEALHDLQQGKSVIINPTWPRLREFGVGSFNVTNEFFLLLLIIFPGFRCLSISLLNIHNVINSYYNLILEIETLPRLSLNTCTTVVNTGLLHVLSYVAPHIEEVQIAAQGKDINMVLNEMLQLHNGFPFLHTLRLYELLHFGVVEFPLEAFIPLGTRLKVLELFGGKSDHIQVREIVMVLKVLPLLEEVTIGFDFGFRCDHTDFDDDDHDDLGFVNVITLRCQSSQLTYEPVMCLLGHFQALQEFAILGKVDNINEVLTCLKYLPELRAVKVVVMEKFGVASLCQLPRQSSMDQRPWELHAATASVDPADRRKLINCGWTFVPVTSYDYL